MLGALGTSLVAALVEDQGTFWLPRQASDMAGRVDASFRLVYWVSVFFFALITFLLVFFVVRFRERKGYEQQPASEHNTPLEVFWSVIPTLIVIGLFWSGYRAYMGMTVAPQNTYEVLVTGQKWNWQFTYPNGYVDAQLHVPVDTAIKLTMSSQDVIHSFFAPDFRVKRDVIPGRYTQVWFTPRSTGEHDIFCTEYCGTNHSSMLSKLVVHRRADFDAWLEDASDFLARMPPAEAGHMLYNVRGCKQCHSVDGTGGIGPTLAGLYGKREVLVGGQAVEVEENYLRRSILEPQGEVVAGFDPVMPTYQGRLKDEEITAIIEYIKTLNP